MGLKLWGKIEAAEVTKPIFMVFFKEIPHGAVSPREPPIEFEPMLWFEKVASDLDNLTTPGSSQHQWGDEARFEWRWDQFGIGRRRKTWGGSCFLFFFPRVCFFCFFSERVHWFIAVGPAHPFDVGFDSNRLPRFQKEGFRLWGEIGWFVYLPTWIYQQKYWKGELENGNPTKRGNDFKLLWGSSRTSFGFSVSSSGLIVPHGVPIESNLWILGRGDL